MLSRGGDTDIRMAEWPESGAAMAERLLHTSLRRAPTPPNTPPPPFVQLGELRRQSIMRNLVRRYVTVEQRKAESQGVTEDDVNEIKQDISAFRCELIEILKNSGMNTATASGPGGGAGGKKNRQKERRLMKGFNIAPPPAATSSPHAGQAGADGASAVELIAGLQDAANAAKSKSPPVSGARLTRLQRLAGATGSGPKRESSKRRWGTLIEAARTGRVRRLMQGRSRSEDSVCSGEGSTRRQQRRGAVAARGDSRDEDDDELDEDLDDEELEEDEDGSSCSGSLREEPEVPEVEEPATRHAHHHGSLSALSAAWGGGLRLGRSILHAPMRLRFLHHHGSSSIESAPGGSNLGLIGGSNLGLTSTGSGKHARKREKRLTRAASVPTRSDEVPEVPPPPPPPTTGNAACSTPLSAPPGPPPPLELIPPPPFPVQESATSPGLSPTQQLLKSRNGSVVLPNLPGIQPIASRQNYEFCCHSYFPGCKELMVQQSEPGLAGKLRRQSAEQTVQERDVSELHQYQLQ
ncbi:hypothetical protein B566_EDAN012550 [Ephemera danica]|nr:hypothetical protein B566_EDAN012550 [Ephemera danica]